MDLAEKIEFVQSTLSPMAWHTHPYIAGVVRIEGAHSGQHVGSALRILAHGRHCIVTAAHVVDQARVGHARVAITATRGGAPYEIRDVPDRVDSRHDLAVYFLPDDYPCEDVRFWPLERTDAGEEQLSTDLLFIHGFPAVRSSSSAFAGGFVNRSFPYGVMRRQDALPSNIEQFEFAMDFDTESMLDREGYLADWLDPHGLAGSAVWRIGASGRRVDTWSPELSVLAGIVTQWRPNEKILVATKCCHIKSLLETT